MNKYQNRDLIENKNQQPTISGPTCIKCGGEAIAQPIPGKSPLYFCACCSKKSK